MKKKDYTQTISKEQLLADLQKFKSLNKLSDYYQIDRRQLSKLAQIYDIHIQTSIEQHNQNKNNLTKELIKTEYLVNKMSTVNIAKKYHVARRIIDQLLIEYNIKKRTKEETIELRSSSLKKSFSINMNRTDDQVAILSSKDKLNDLILSLPENDRTLLKLQEILNYNMKHIGKKIHEYGLENLINYKLSTSYYEDEIEQLIKSFGIQNIERNSTKYLDGQEIDVYLPDYKIGIEFNGNYWHSDIYKTDHNGRSTYHQNKSLLAEQKGIFLFHIFEYEWLDPILKEKIINRLKTILNLNANKIYARKCEIRPVTKNDKKIFLNRYHLQGNDSSSIELGLYYNNDLVALMTFCKARFTNATWELSRYCVKNDYNVIGGASRLFTHFVKENMKLNETCVTYNDITKTRGDLYDHLSFKFDHIAQPNYVWWNPVKHQILTRYQCKMVNEVEYMHENGFNRICDCGNKVWIYK